MIIYEDNNGTYIHTNKELDLINNVNEIKKFNVDTIRIDTFLHDEK
jgi:collagenase-like PrtC family protease